MLLQVRVLVFVFQIHLCASRLLRLFLSCGYLFEDGYKWWSGQCLSWRSLFIIVVWFLWKWRNAQIFQESKEPLHATLQRIMACHDSLLQVDSQSKKVCKKELGIFSYQTPAAFFDGAERNHCCGCGVVIVMSDSLHYSLSWHGGFGSNSLVEARALSGLLAFCVFLGIQSISIFGDSKSLIHHVNGLGLINCPHLLGWLSSISFFRNLINLISFQHIPCSWNSQADILSKDGLSMQPSLCSLSVMLDGSSLLIQDFSINGM